MRHLSRTTRRLTLVAATAEHLLTEIASPEQLGELLQAVVPAGWPPGEYDTEAQEFFLGRLLEGGDDVVGWYGWYALAEDRGSQRPVLIAAGGFLGPPDANGDVEIGYSVHAQWRRQGFAKELVHDLVTFALENRLVRRIVAHTTTENVASCEVLRTCGFSALEASLEPPAVAYELWRTHSPG